MTKCQLYDKIEIVKEEGEKKKMMTSELATILISLVIFAVVTKFIEYAVKNTLVWSITVCVVYYLFTHYDVMSWIH